jgi:hypothetical protein
MRSCIMRNCGTSRMITLPTLSSSAGIETSRSSDSGPSSRTARITPPISVIGAVISMVNDMTTSSWTWVTSLVMRVISEGAPK